MKRLGDFGSQSAVLKSAALGSPEKFLDMPSIRSLPRSTEIENLGVGPSSLFFTPAYR